MRDQIKIILLPFPGRRLQRSLDRSRHGPPLRYIFQCHDPSSLLNPLPPSSTPPHPVCGLPMASSSSSSSSSSRGPRARHANSFRPQFPINPFGHHSLAPRPSSLISSTLGDPWLLKPDQAPVLTACRRDVILVLGGKPRARYSVFISSLLASPSSPLGEMRRSVAGFSISRSLACHICFPSFTSPSLRPCFCRSGSASRLSSRSRGYWCR